MPTCTRKFWHGGRENVFAAMRRLDEWCQYHRNQAQSLCPPYGTISLGSADFDHLLNAVVGEEYLRALRRGSNPSTALALATTAGTKAVRQWNNHGHGNRAFIIGRFELQRWQGTGEAEARSVHELFLIWLK